MCMNRGLGRIIACVLAVILFIDMTFSSSLTVLYSYAADGGEASLKDKVIEEGEDYTIFKGKGAQSTLEMYPYPIRVKDADGQLQDIDASIVQSDANPDEYTNACGLADITIPKEPSVDDPIKVKHDDYEFTFSPMFTDEDSLYDFLSMDEEIADAEEDIDSAAEDDESPESVADDEALDVVESEVSDGEDNEAADAEAYIEEDDVSEAEEIIRDNTENRENFIENNKLYLSEVIEEKVEDIYHEKNEKQVGLSFDTPDPKVSLEYYATDAGIKEDIILADVPEDNEFKFVIRCTGSIPELKYRAIIFNDEKTGEEIGAIQEPFMTDSSKTEDHGYSEELSYSLEAVDEQEGTYIVTLEVSRAYLNDKERVYPVTIDPTYTANTSSTVQSAYVLSKNNTSNYYSSGIKKMCIGYGANDGIARTFIHFPKLQSTISGKYINSATFAFTEYENSAKNTAFGIYRVTGSWTNSKITYKNQPSYHGTAVATGKVNGKSSYRQSLNVTSLVQGWASETYTNNGILLKASTEKSATKNFSSFYNAYYSTASKRPSLSVTYTAPSPATPAAPATVKVNKAYIKKGASPVTVSWTGTTTNLLKNMQVQVNNASGTAVLAYTNAGTGSSYNINTSAYANGKYTVYVRAVDKLGKAGAAKTATFIVDGDAPNTPANISITSERSKLGQGHEEEACVTVKIPSGSDRPASNSSGIASYNIGLYKAGTNTLLEQKNDIAPATNGGCSAVFDEIESGIEVYAKVSCKDKCDNASADATSQTVKVKNTSLPSFDEAGSFVSDLVPAEKWRSHTNTATEVSWNADYDGELGRITLTVKDASGKALDGYNGVEILKDENFPKSYKNLRLDRIIDYTTLQDGEYTIELKFIPQSEMSEAAPYGRVKTLELGIDNTAPVIQGEILPDTDDPLSGLVQLSCGATDDRTAVETKAFIRGEDGTYRELTLSSNNINLNTTEYDDGTYTIRYVFTDKAGNSSETEKTYTFSNAAPTPKIVLSESYGNGPVAFRYTYPSGDASVSKVAKLQAAFVPEGSEPEEADFADLNVDDPGTSGESVYDIGDTSDGAYDLCVRSVDQAGNTGVIRKQTYSVDTSRPAISLVRPADTSDDVPAPVIGLVPIRGAITDAHLKSYSVSYAAGENPSDSDYETIRIVQDTAGRSEINGLIGTVDLSDDTAYPAGSLVRIRIDATDKAGNTETLYRDVVKRETIDHDADFTIDRGEADALSITTEHQSFALKQNESEYIPDNPVWLIDGTVSEQEESGVFDFSDTTAFPDESLLSVAVYDRKQNGDILYGVPTSEYVAANTSSQTTPASTASVSGNTISIPDGADEAVYETEIVPERDTVSMKVDAIQTSDEGASIEYYASVDEGDYHEISEGEEYLITEEPFASDNTGDHHIRFKAVLKKGEVANSPVISSYNLSARVLRSEQASMDLMTGYDPLTVTEIPELNYKVKISWQMAEGLDTSDVTYEVYRSTSEDFAEENTVLVQEGLTDTSWYDSYALIDKDTNANNHEGTRARARKIPNADFYYKVKAVKGYGTEHVRKSHGTEGSGVMLPAMDEYAKRLGIKEYWGYSESDLGAGTGYVEQSRGNFVYQETDAYVKGKVLDLAMQRTYNSMSSGMTPLGYSWDFSFNPILLDTYDSYGDNTGMLFKDGSGTIYTFRSIPNGEGIKRISSSEIEAAEQAGTGDDAQDEADTANLIGRVETTYRSPLGAYIELKRIDTLDVNDDDQDGDREEVTDTSYTVRMLSGDTYTFNRSCQITSYRDTNNNEVQYTYDDYGRLIEVENPNGKTQEQRESGNSDAQGKRCIIRFTYYDDDNEDDIARELIRTATLPNGQIIKYEYNDNKMLTAAKLYGSGSGDSNVQTTGSPVTDTSYSYNGNNVRLMTSVTDPNGNTSNISYAQYEISPGRCSAVTYPNGDKEEYKFSRADGEEQLYDRLEVEYTLRGRLGTGINAGTERYWCNVDGNIIETQDIDGSVTRSTYRLGLEWETSGEVDVYEIADNGTISRRQETVSSKKTYNLLNGGSAAKIASTDGNIKSETDADGNKTTYEYSGSGDANRENPTRIVTRVRDGSDMHESFEYDSGGNVIAAVDGDTGEKVTYTYDSNGQVLNETFYGTDGSTESGATTYTYDDQGNVTSETSTNGSSPSSSDHYVYDKYGRLTSETDARGYVTKHEYDALDREVRTTYLTDDSSLTEEKTYDKNGNLTMEKDRDGRVTSYSYDNMDRVTSRTVSKGSESYTWSYSYSAGNYTCTYESGDITYSGATITEIRNPDGVVTSTTVNDHAGRTVMTEEKGVVTTYRYNRDGEAVEMYTVGSQHGSQGETLGISVLSNYDKNGNNTATIVNPGWNGTNFYVADDTQVYRYSYDSLGNILKRYDPLNHLVKHRYDSNGKMTRTATAASNGTDEEVYTTAKYDIPVSNGNTITRITNAMGQVSETETDPSGNVVRLSDLGLDGSARIDTTYTYDALGNLIAESNAHGTKTYTYDAMNNMTESVAVTGEGADTSTQRSTYTYDSFGMMTSRKDYTGDNLDREARFSYDCLKRLVKYYQGDPLADGQEPDWISYTYDIEDNLTAVDYPDFMQTDKVLYIYDKYCRVTNIKMSTHNSAANSLVREYEYRTDNRVAAVNDYSSGSRYVRKAFTYDDIGHCTGIDVTDGANNRQIDMFRYTYDKCNNIISEEMMHTSESTDNASEDGEGSDDGDSDPEPAAASTDHIASDGSYHIRRDYTYNDLAELTGVQEYKLSGDEDNPSETLLHTIVYTYDNIGSRTSETIDGTTSTYNYDANGLNQLIKITVAGDSNGARAKTYSYDGAGNLVSAVDNEAGTTTDYTYNVNGEMLKAVVTGSDGSTVTTANKYDGTGTRVSRTVTKKNGSGEVLSSETTGYLVAADELLCTYIPSDSAGSDAGVTISSENIFGIDGRPILTIRGTGSRFIYVGDLRGSTVSIINEEEAAVQVNYYDVYGQPERWGSFTNDILYTGAIYDKSTGLYYLSSRYYDSSTGRFMSEDSVRGDINNPLSLNLYGYCLGNPIKYTDINGTWPTLLQGICKRAKKTISNVKTTVKKSLMRPKKKIKVRAGKTLKKSKIKPISKKKHFKRNDIQNNYNKSYKGGEKKLVADARKEKNGWKKAEKSENIYHMNTYSSQGALAKYNTKYTKLNRDGSSYEVIIGRTKKGHYYIVRDPVNMGTYNYSDKSNWLGHFTQDMVPYFIWGNTQDPMEKEYRRREFAQKHN